VGTVINFVWIPAKQGVEVCIYRLAFLYTMLVSVELGGDGQEGMGNM